MTKPTPEAAKMLAPVLAWLEAGAPHETPVADDIGFTMCEFIDSYADQDAGPIDWAGQNCGTACCIAGAVAIFNPEVFSDAEPVGIEDVSKALGLNDSEELALFYCKDSEKRRGFSLSTVTPQEAAKTLRRFLETGKIVWDRLEKEITT